jgi:hypothetical protein
MSLKEKMLMKQNLNANSASMLGSIGGQTTSNLQQLAN